VDVIEYEATEGVVWRQRVVLFLIVNGTGQDSDLIWMWKFINHENVNHKDCRCHSWCLLDRCQVSIPKSHWNMNFNCKPVSLLFCNVLFYFLWPELHKFQHISLQKEFGPATWHSSTSDHKKDMVAFSGKIEANLIFRDHLKSKGCPQSKMHNERRAPRTRPRIIAFRARSDLVPMIPQSEVELKASG